MITKEEFIKIMSEFFDKNDILSVSSKRINAPLNETNIHTSWKEVIEITAIKKETK